MRTDILDLHHFYETPLGRLARDSIAGHVAQLWDDCAGLRIAGFGYASPYLQNFPDSRATLALAPDAQGVMRWPDTDPDSHTHRPPRNRACLVHEGFWPLPDRSIDRILIVHGLEEVRDASRLLREVWRVLADDGKLIIVAAQRRGLWATFDTTPMAAGRPWLRGQLNRLLEKSMFTPQVWRRALNFPPFRHQLVYRTAGTLDGAGQKFWPGFCGALIVEADKTVMQPLKGTPQRALRVIRPQLSGRFVPGARPVSSVQRGPLGRANSQDAGVRD